MSAAELDDLLGRGASVNIYMFHGGTNFGFTNGANHKGRYLPITTSYDYDAPLAEDGSPTDKYEALRAVLGRYASLPAETPEHRPPAPAFPVVLERRVELREVVPELGSVREWDHVPTVDEAGHWSGLMLYSAQVRAEDAVVSFAEVRDGAIVTLDGEPVGALHRTTGDRTVNLPHRAGTLDVLVENQGRVDYGPRIGEAKGLVGPARTLVREITDWRTVALDLDTLSDQVVAELRAAERGDAHTPVRGLTFSYATFDTAGGTDHFLRMDGWSRGLVWVNNFLLGRYSSAGPTSALYVPAPLVRDRGNEIVILELLGAAAATVDFVSSPELGHIDE